MAWNLRTRLLSAFHVPVYLHTKKLSYHLKGNLLLSDLNPLQYSEIFRLAGNYKSDAFYRAGCYQIWKVEGSTCMIFKLSEIDMMSTMFWSTQETISVYHKVANADFEKNPTVTSLDGTWSICLWLQNMYSYFITIYNSLSFP